MFARFDAERCDIDILVNNAGIRHPASGIRHRQPLADLALSDWQRVNDTNLTSAFLIGREAARRMIGRGHGRIINIGSLSSELARAKVIPYTFAKVG